MPRCGRSTDNRRFRSRLASAPIVFIFVGVICSMPAVAWRAAQQDKPEVPTFRSGTTLVEVDVIVKDGAGRFVPDMTAMDFELFEDGVRQSIDTFYEVNGSVPPTAAGAPTPATPARSLGTSVPRETIRRVFVLMFDEEHMAVGGLVKAKQAAASFLSTEFQEGDIGGVVANLRVVGGHLTSVRADLEAAVRAIQPTEENRSWEQSMREWPRLLSQYEALRADRRDAYVVDRLVERACADDHDQCAAFGSREAVRQEIVGKAQRLVSTARISATRTLTTLDGLLNGLEPLPGRKTVIFLSDGFLSEDLAGQLQAVVARAALAQVRIYVLDTRGLNRGSADSHVLDAPAVDRAGLPRFDVGADGPNSLAVDTGGLMIRNENDFPRALREISQDTSAYYVLGYRPTNKEFDGGFRSLKVRVARAGLTVRARRGYLAHPPSKAASPVVEPRTEEVSPIVPTATTTVAPGYVIAPPPANGQVAANVGVIRFRPAGLEATALQTAALPTHGSLPPTLVRQLDDGWAAYQRGDTSAARTTLAAVCGDPAAPLWAHYVLGWASFAEGDFTKATAEWQYVHGQVPEFEPVYFNLADSFLRQRSPMDALRVLREAEHRWPEDLEVLNAIGVMDVTTGAFADAIAIFKRALAITTGDVTSAFNLARTAEITYVKSLSTGTADDRDRLDAIANYQLAVKDPGSIGALAREGVHRVSPLEVAQLHCSSPATIASLSREGLSGRPTVLAWNPDGQQLYVRGGGDSEVAAYASPGDRSRRTGQSAPRGTGLGVAVLGVEVRSRRTLVAIATVCEPDSPAWGHSRPPQRRV